MDVSSQLLSDLCYRRKKTPSIRLTGDAAGSQFSQHSVNVPIEIPTHMSKTHRKKNIGFI
jgi:hypothetical protein